MNDLHKRLLATVQESNLWNDGAANKLFLMSPEVYQLPKDKAEELARLGNAVKNCFAGLNRMAVDVSDPQNGHSKDWKFIRSVLQNGNSKVHRRLQQQNPDESSIITKIDLMEDLEGNFKIAEVDGYNPRGMGYSTLAARLRSVNSPTSETLPGVAERLAVELGKFGGNTLCFLYPERERFYLPEFNILKSELEKLGVELEVVSETDFVFRDQKLFVVLPVLYHNTALTNQLAELYLSGAISFLIPPKPFYGSKSVLALLTNTTRDPESNDSLEQILRHYIDGDSLDTIRKHTPPTYLVGKPAGKVAGGYALELTAWEKALENNPHILKMSVSSGMKGVFFPHHRDFQSKLQEAAGMQGHFVIQQQVNQLPHDWQYFDQDGNLQTGTFHTRVTAHIIGDDLADICVTARQDEQVHGATDCLQLGTVLV